MQRHALHMSRERWGHICRGLHHIRVVRNGGLYAEDEAYTAYTSRE